MSLLSSSNTPIARRVESWLPTDAGTHLQRAFGYCEVRGRLTADASDAMPVATLGPIGQAWLSGVARAVGGDQLQGEWWDRDPGADGMQSVMVIPVFAESAVSEVIALYY